MKKLIITVCLLIGISTNSLALETPLGIDYAPDIESIVKLGELRVAMYGGFAPSFQNHTLSPSGYDVLVAKAIADQLKVKLHIDSSPTFDGAVALVAEGKDDIAVSNLTATPNRALSVAFSAPYYEMPQALLLKKGTVVLGLKLKQEIISTKALRIGVAAASSYVYYAKLAFPQATVLTYTDLKEGAKNLAKGQYDAVFTDALSAQQVVDGDHALATLPLGKVHTDPLSIAVNNNQPHLLNWLNVYLSSAEEKAAQLTWKAQAQLA